jgi:hypothetical protein
MASLHRHAYIPFLFRISENMAGETPPSPTDGVHVGDRQTKDETEKGSDGKDGSMKEEIMKNGNTRIEDTKVEHHIEKNGNVRQPAADAATVVAAADGGCWEEKPDGGGEKEAFLATTRSDFFSVTVQILQAL